MIEYKKNKTRCDYEKKTSNIYENWEYISFQCSWINCEFQTQYQSLKNKNHECNENLLQYNQSW